MASVSDPNGACPTFLIPFDWSRPLSCYRIYRSNWVCRPVLMLDRAQDVFRDLSKISLFMIYTINC